jgi:hypothetical protein
MEPSLHRKCMFHHMHLFWEASMQKSHGQAVECIQHCWDCRTTCQRVLYHYFLEEGREKTPIEIINIMTDCMSTCQTAADFMIRGSTLHASYCALCAIVCEACANACERIGTSEMMLCAEMCRACAQSCQTMAMLRRAA